MAKCIIKNDEESIKKGWIIHEFKKRDLGANFAALYDKKTGRYFDPVEGWTTKRPTKRVISTYDRRRKRNRLGMEVIFNFEKDEMGMYLFSLYTDGKDKEWVMDGMYYMFDTPSGQDFFRGREKDGNMIFAQIKDIDLWVFGSDLLHLSSSIVCDGTCYFNRDDFGKIVLTALNGGVKHSGDKPYILRDMALGMFHDSVLTNIQILKLLWVFHCMHSPLNEGKMLDLLSRHNLKYALNEFIIARSDHSKQCHFNDMTMLDELLDRTPDLVKENLRVETVVNLLEICFLMRVKKVDELNVLVGYLSARRHDIDKDGTRFKMIKVTDAMVDRLTHYGTIKKWNLELD